VALTDNVMFFIDSWRRYQIIPSEIGSMTVAFHDLLTVVGDNLYLVTEVRALYWLEVTTFLQN